MSAIVTTISSFVVFPEASVAVTVIMFAPNMLQPKVAVLKVHVTSQLSVTVPLMSFWVKVTVPSAPKIAYEFVMFKTGMVLSITVTVALELLVFPLTSVAVSTTVFVPKSSQSNDVLSSVNVN